MPVVLKKDAMVYGIVYQTQSHTVLRPINRSKDFCADEVKVISNTMFNYRGLTVDMLEGGALERQVRREAGG